MRGEKKITRALADDNIFNIIFIHMNSNILHIELIVYIYTHTFFLHKPA